MLLIFVFVFQKPVPCKPVYSLFIFFMIRLVSEAKVELANDEEGHEHYQKLAGLAVSVFREGVNDKERHEP